MKNLLVIILFACIVMSTRLNAQDAHYWTEQFGNRSTLMSGSVVGSVTDLGAMYYNPSRLALQDDPTFLISAKAFQNVTLRVKGSEQQQSLGSSTFGTAPTLVAGSFNLDSVKFLKFFHGHKFAYGFLSRNQFDYTLSLTDIQTREFNDAWAGEEQYLSEVYWNKNVTDEWMGLTWAMPLTEDRRWTLGITQFVSTYSQSSNYTQSIVGKEEDEGNCTECEVVTYEFTRNRDINHTGYLAKIGLNYSSRYIDVGLTYTSPKATLASTGSYNYRQILTNYGNSFSDHENLAEIGWGDATTFQKTPMSAALGVGIKLGKNVISFSAEWFDAVDEYYVLIPDNPINRQSPEDGTQILNRYVDKRKSVINYGIGIEWYLNKSVHGFTSFATDHSSLEKTFFGDSFEETDGFDNNFFSGDILHLGGGLEIELKKMNFTLGAVYSWGEQTIGRVGQIPGQNNPDSGIDPNATTDLIWERWKILVGFDLPFYKFGS